MKNVKNTKTILFASLIAAMILPFSGMQVAEAEKAPDFTDYKSMYQEIDKKIRDNKKSLDENEEKIKDKSLSKNKISSIEKDIKAKKDKNAKLFEEADDIQRLNIESYKLDSETQQVFDDAAQSIRDNYSEKGVYDLFVESKYRKVVVFVDPVALEDKSQAEADAFVSEIKNSVNVDVEVQITPLIKTHSTSCSSPTSACNPGKGGIQIAHSGSGGGSTLGFKAYHPTHGYGFIIAAHEALDTTGTRIVQPDNGGTYGYVDVIGGSLCDCAFVDFSGHSMYDDIWAYDLSTIYPVGIRNTAATPAGTFIIVDGVGSSYHLGTITVEGNYYGFVDFGTSPGDSGAAVFQPQVDGTVKVYGIMTDNVGTYSIYEPYDYIKSQLGLTW